MPRNQFEDSRISEGSLRKDAQKVHEKGKKPPDESKAISRDDVRDGVVPPPKASEPTRKK